MDLCLIISAIRFASYLQKVKDTKEDVDWIVSLNDVFSFIYSLQICISFTSTAQNAQGTYIKCCKSKLYFSLINVTALSTTVCLYSILLR